MIMPMSTTTDCLCPTCLPVALNEQIEKFIASNPIEKVIVAAQKQSTPTLLENIDYTIEDGNWVFSKWYHLKRGTCCDNGCRNCPF